MHIDKYIDIQSTDNQIHSGGYSIVVAHFEFPTKKHLNCGPFGQMKNIVSFLSFRPATHTQLWKLHQNCINCKIEVTFHCCNITTMIRREWYKLMLIISGNILYSFHSIYIMLILHFELLPYWISIWILCAPGVMIIGRIRFSKCADIWHSFWLIYGTENSHYFSARQHL